MALGRIDPELLRQLDEAAISGKSVTAVVTLARTPGTAPDPVVAAERKMAFSTCAIDACGRACISSAARPATCGVAIDDPDSVRQPPPRLAEITSTPGATRSGVSGCSCA